MLRILGIFATLLAGAVQAQPNGFPARSLYACHAQAINEALIRECSRYPELAKRGEAALKAWKSQYGQKASLVGSSCTLPSEASLKAHLLQLQGAATQPDFCRHSIEQMLGGPGSAEERIWN